MTGMSLCKNILINVNRIIVPRRYEEKYIKFSQFLDNLLKLRYSKYYCCDQVNQNNDCSNIFYVEAFYNNVPGVYEIYPEISALINNLYSEIFSDKVIREHITGFTTTSTVYPETGICNCYDYHKCDCDIPNVCKA